MRLVLGLREDELHGADDAVLVLGDEQGAPARLDVLGDVTPERLRADGLEGVEEADAGVAVDGVDQHLGEGDDLLVADGLESSDGDVGHLLARIYGLNARKTKAPKSTRWTPPSWTVARPGRRRERADRRRDREEHHLRRAEPEHELPVEPDRRDRDAAGIVSPMLAIAEPSARLKLVWTCPRCALRTAASASGEQDEQGDRDPDGRQRRAGSPRPRPRSVGDSTLAKADDGDDGDDDGPSHQHSRATVRPTFIA